MKYIGTDRAIHDARGKANGSIKYAADIDMAGMVHLGMVFSTVPHGYVEWIDDEKAKEIPGVLGVFHCFNTPELTFNRYRSIYAQELPDEEPVFMRQVRFVGDRVAVVAAEDAATARRAAALVEVKYERLPHAFTVQEALEKSAGTTGSHWQRDSFSLEIGALPDTAGEATVACRTESSLPPLHHLALEPHVCIADYDAETDFLTVISPNQSVHGIRNMLSGMLRMPQSRIRVVKSTMGGSFGAKQEWVLEPVAACCARLLKRPVKLVYSRAEAMRSTICRGQMQAAVRSLFYPDGRMLSLEIDLLSNAGAYIGNSSDYVRTLAGKMFRCYRYPHAKYRAEVVTTNTPVAGAFRGWSSPEAHIMIEHNINQAARRLAIDPIELRLKNVLLPGDEDKKMRLPIGEVRTRECLLAGRERFDWHAKKTADAAFNQTNARYKRGVGVACGGHGNSYLPRFNDFAGVELRLAEDGSVLANMTLHDHGCGTVTAMKMILAEALEIEPERIYLAEGDTSHTPFDFGCFASRTTFVVGRAAYNCARKLRKTLMAGVADVHALPPDEIYMENAQVRCKSDPGFVRSYGQAAQEIMTVLRREVFADERYHNVTNPGVTGTHFAHVEVDTYAGLVRVLGYLAAHDIGQAINRAMCVAQIQGAVAMGIGAALSEQMLVAPDGASTDSLKKYKIVNAPSLPTIDVLLIEDGDTEGPYGAKSIGELSYVPVAPAVCAAVNEALGSDIGELPLNPERILACLTKGEQKC